MSKHTPGPWVAVARTNAYIDIEAPEQHRYSARKVASTSLTNHEANARLIAAAPELLEALTLCRKELLKLCFADWSIIIALEKASRAIAKTEDRT